MHGDHRDISVRTPSLPTMRSCGLSVKGGCGGGSCRSSPLGGGGPCEEWWRGTRGVSCPSHVARLRPCPSTTFGGPPPRSGEDRPPPVVFCRPEAALTQLQTPQHTRLTRGAVGQDRQSAR